MKELKVIGRGELVSFPTLGIKDIPAKIDTGADVSSIWCSKIELVGDELHAAFFGPGMKNYKPNTHTFRKKEFSITRISNSFGHREIRYKVKIPVILAGRHIKATFTLSNRSQKLYPVLIGNKSLRGKFLVDASIKSPLESQELKRQKKLEAELSNLKEIK